MINPWFFKGFFIFLEHFKVDLLWKRKTGDIIKIETNGPDPATTATADK